MQTGSGEQARHARVKQIFLGALEVPESERNQYLEKACGGERELRKEVEALLGAHHDSTVMFVGAGMDATNGSLERFSKLFDLLSFISRTRVRKAILLSAGLAVTFAAGWWARTRARDMLLAQTASTLRVVVDGNAAALTTLTSEWKAAAERAAGKPYMGAAMEGLGERGKFAEWKSMVDRELSGSGHDSYFLVNRAGLLVATSEGLRTGEATASGMATIGRVLSDKTMVEFPSVRPNFGEVEGEGPWPRAMVCAPVKQGDGTIAGMFVVVYALDEVGKSLVRGRPFETGETYLFREDGVLLSPTRFAGALEGWKMLKPMFRLRDPGRNLYASQGVRPGEDDRAWPLTEVIRIATAKEQPNGSEQAGVILKPYRDYRGVPVVGAWRWFPDLKAGVVAEVDETEVLQTLRFIDWPIGVFTVLLAAAGGWTVLSSQLLTRLRRRTVAEEAIGQYRLVEKLGEGGVGEVYLAEHALLKRPAAVKLLRRDRLGPAFYEQFEREAKAASRLRHPNTVQIYDFGTARDGTPYYVMEYVPGMDLGKCIHQEGPMAEGRAVHIVKQICGALQEAHGANILHRDIKPANVMLCEVAGEADFVKILDFGLAKDITDPDETSLMFRSGTPFYTAPERVLPKGPVDQRCDLYSLGVLTYYLLCGRVPFDGSNWIECALYEEPIPPSRHATVSPTVERIILDCIAREPGERPSSAGELLGRLNAVPGISP